MPVVAEVVFTGSKVIPDGSLREAIRGVAIGARFTESRFRQLLDTSHSPALRGSWTGRRDVSKNHIGAGSRRRQGREGHRGSERR